MPMSLGVRRARETTASLMMVRGMISKTAIATAMAMAMAMTMVTAIKMEVVMTMVI
jgi:hypothetical protein